MKKGLGKGLSALLGEEALVAVPEGNSSLKEVALTSLAPSSFQPREIFDNEELEALAASIKANGILQPILVRKKGTNEYEIIAGERRWRAAQRVGYEKIPIIEKHLSDEEALTIALVENIQRENLNAVEEAQAYQRIMEKSGYTQEHVAELVGKSRAHIANTLRLNQLSDKIKNYIKDGKITAGHAKVLVGIKDAESILDLIVQKNLNVRQTERLVQKLKNVAHQEASALTATPEVEKRQKENLMEALLHSDEESLRIQSFIEEMMKCKTIVQIKGENNITISFHLTSMDELDTFMARINNSVV